MDYEKYYTFSESQIAKIKLKLLELRKEKQLWEQAKEKATNNLKKSSIKQYAGIRDSIRVIDKKIQSLTDRIKEFSEAIERGYIEL